MGKKKADTKVPIPVSGECLDLSRSPGRGAIPYDDGLGHVAWSNKPPGENAEPRWSETEGIVWVAPAAAAPKNGERPGPVVSDPDVM